MSSKKSKLSEVRSLDNFKFSDYLAVSIDFDDEAEVDYIVIEPKDAYQPTKTSDLLCITNDFQTIEDAITEAYEEELLDDIEFMNAIAELDMYAQIEKDERQTIDMSVHYTDMLDLASRLIDISTIQRKTLFDRVLTVAVQLPNGHIVSATRSAVSKKSFNQTFLEKLCLGDIKQKIVELYTHNYFETKFEEAHGKDK